MGASGTYIRSSGLKNSTGPLLNGKKLLVVRCLTSSNKCISTSNKKLLVAKCIATSYKCITISS